MSPFDKFKAILGIFLVYGGVGAIETSSTLWLGLAIAIVGLTLVLNVTGNNLIEED